MPAAKPTSPEALIPDSSLFVRARICPLYWMPVTMFWIATIRTGPACVFSSAISSPHISRNPSRANDTISPIMIPSTFPE